MKIILFIFILMNLVCCKENKIDSQKKFDYVDVDNNGNAKKTPKTPIETDEIGYLYQPERMETEEIKKNIGKNDYQYTLTNSDLLDSDLQNLKIHSRKIVTAYYKLLIRVNIPFNCDKIIVKIIHRNGKVDILKYSEKEIQEIIK